MALILWSGSSETQVNSAEGALTESEDAARKTLAPSVIITNVVADGARFYPEGTLTLGSKVGALRIDYTASNPGIPEGIIFKYRLSGRDPDWQQASSRRSAFYADLPPGRYEFQIIAGNEGGVWSKVKRLTLTLPPTIFQTAWFRWLCACAAAALLMALFMLRRWRMLQPLRGLERLRDARVEERTRMARELHDSMLQDFQGVMFRLQAVRHFLPGRPAEAATELDAALEVGDRAITESRNAARDLREPSLIQGDLSETLAALGEEFANPSLPPTPGFQVVTEGEPRALHPLARDEIYRVARQAIRNAYQHAGARQIQTELVFGATDFTLRVRDNGAGIDPKVLADGRRDGRWGLQGMRERALTFNGRLNVWSHLGEGTEIELKIPAQMAYVRIKGAWLHKSRSAR